MTIVVRADRAVIRFSGADAHRLLNDVVTGMMPQAPGTASWWALLTPQGKVLAEGLAGFAGDALHLDVDQSVADDFLRRMKMYRLRAKVEIEDLRESHRLGWSPEAVAGAVVHKDRLGPVALGFRVIAPADEAAGWSTETDAYHRARIDAGIAALGPDFGAGEVFAHDIGMDQLEGIDFAKGCYVGQEVVSRMKHRGTARRRPVVASGLQADESGAAILAGEREAGTVGAVVDGKAVAVVRLDRLADGKSGTVNGRPVTLTLPAWAGYGFGESPADD